MGLWPHDERILRQLELTDKERKQKAGAKKQIKKFIEKNKGTLERLSKL